MTVSLYFFHLQLFTAKKQVQVKHTLGRIVYNYFTIGLSKYSISISDRWALICRHLPSCPFLYAHTFHLDWIL